MILSCSNINKSFGEKTVLASGSFVLNDREKSAIVGINGAGKTTLLKLITGELELDSGSITIPKDINTGYLKQQDVVDLSGTIYSEVMRSKDDIRRAEKEISDMEDEMRRVSGAELGELMERYHRALDEFEANGGYTYKSEVEGIIKGLGFTAEDFDRKVSELSGGQKTRVALGALLAGKHRFIILDEPTNHLDINSCVWLEGFLKNYPGAVLVVSHDRYFIDNVADSIIEIDSGRIEKYEGNYSRYVKLRDERRKTAMRAYENQQDQIRHEKEVIEKLKSFNREKSIKRAESRMKALDKIEIIERPNEADNKMRGDFSVKKESGKDVLQISGLEKTYGKRKLFRDLELVITRGERVALIGENGTGKSTILKIINGRVTPDAGEIRLGTNVDIAYYDQEQQELDERKTVFEEISDAYPALNNTQIRNVLAAFLFRGEDVFKEISSLSGGERGRVLFAKLMLKRANFLILDEPTNHLDIDSKEALESQLKNYDGTLLFVSHDRYFINKVADRVIELDNRGIFDFPGNYDYYLEKRDVVVRASADTEQTVARQETSAKTDWKKKKEETARLRKRENELKRIEEEIETLENEKAGLENEMAAPEVATNSAELGRLHTRIQEIEDELLVLMDKWEESQQEMPT